MKIPARLLTTITIATLVLASSTFAAPSQPDAAPPMGGEGASGIESVQIREPSVVEETRPSMTPTAPAPIAEETLRPAPPPAPTTPFNIKATDEISRINAATEVLQEITGIPEGISPTLLANAYGVVIIPGTIKLGFIFGGQYGSGIAMTRGEDGAWSNPSFVYIAGGSFGLQFGAVSSDIILVFKTRKSVMGLTKGNFTLGGDAAVAAGPVGRRAVAATDWQLKAEIYSYARSRGLFAGISLDGSVLAIDTNANETFYANPNISANEIFGAPPSSSPAVERLKNFLGKSASAPSMR
jgi:lipid-binding SYLF domain-containing protein